MRRALLVSIVVHAAICAAAGHGAEGRGAVPEPHRAPEPLSARMAPTETEAPAADTWAGDTFDVTVLPGSGADPGGSGAEAPSGAAPQAQATPDSAPPKNSAIDSAPSATNTPVAPPASTAAPGATTSETSTPAASAAPRTKIPPILPKPKKKRPKKKPPPPVATVVPTAGVASATSAASTAPAASASSSAAPVASGTASAGDGGDGAGKTGTFGAAGAAGVRDLGRAFTRAIPPACDADSVWSEVALGALGPMRAKVLVNAEGRVESAEPVSDKPPNALVRLLRRTVPLLGSGAFSLREGAVSAGSEILEISATVSAEPAAEGAGEGGDKRLSFSYESGKGKASFTHDGRRVDVAVRVVSVDVSK